MKPLRKQGIILFTILALVLVACGGAAEETVLPKLLECPVHPPRGSPRYVRNHLARVHGDEAHIWEGWGVHWGLCGRCRPVHPDIPDPSQVQPTHELGELAPGVTVERGV